MLDSNGSNTTAAAALAQIAKAAPLASKKVVVLAGTGSTAPSAQQRARGAKPLQYLLS
jgi:hypothetical protein